jgi:hypothetical protein
MDGEYYTGDCRIIFPFFILNPDIFVCSQSSSDKRTSTSSPPTSTKSSALCMTRPATGKCIAFAFVAVGVRWTTEQKDGHVIIASDGDKVGVFCLWG